MIRMWCDKVVIDTPDRCWEWAGYIDSKGYPKSGSTAGTFHPHRRVAQMFWPDVTVVHHLCENPRCLNPAHLQPLGSHEEHGRIHKKEFCRRGHSMEDAYVLRSGERKCRPCQLRRQAEYQRRRRASLDV